MWTYVRVLSHLKEEQAWAADKRFWVICYVLVKGAKEYSCFKFKQYFVCIAV